MEEKLNKISEYFKLLNINLNNEQTKQFVDYYNLLVEWNSKFNLTTITDFDEVVKKHFMDSVQAVMHLNENAKVIDVGCGAGFPSIPLKILRPDLDFVLVDSVNKKITFIDEVIKVLKLKKIKAIHSRIEDLAKKSEYRENFDYSVARAVSKLNTLYEYPSFFKN